MRHIWIILLILPFALPAQRTLIADDAEIGDSLSLAGEWISLIRKDTNFWASTHGEVPSTRAILEWFGAQSAGIPGTGNEGFLTYWDSDSTLAYINVSYTATELNASALTGSFRWPTGTTAQQPVGANGNTRFNSTTGLFEGYHNDSYRPFATFDGTRTSGQISYWDGTTLTSNTRFKVNSLTDGVLSFGFSSNATQILYTSDGSSDDHRLDITSTRNLYIRTSGSSTSYPSNLTQNQNSPYTIRIQNNIFGNRGILIWAGSKHNGAKNWSERAQIEAGGTNFITTTRMPDFFIKAQSVTDAHSTTNIAGSLYLAGGTAIGAGAVHGNVILALNDETPIGMVGVKTSSPTTDFDLNGKARIRTLPDSVAAYIATADASGYIYRATPVDVVSSGLFIAYGEYYAADTLTITSSTPVKLQGSAAGITASITHSSGRLTYTGSTTYTFSVDFSASVDASSTAEVSFWVYKNGSPVSSSKQVHKITPGEINVVSTGCSVSLAQNDYVEVFFDVDTSCDVYIRNSNLKIKKI